MRRALHVVALLLAALVLTGCMRIDIDARVSRDETVSGTIEIGLDVETLERSGVEVGDDPEAALGQVFNLEAFDALEDDDRLDVTVDELSSKDEVGLRLTFDDLSMRQFVEVVVGSEDAQSGQYVFERTGDRYRFSIAPDPEEQATAQRLGDEKLDFRLAMTFPGDILDTDGTVDGRTVVWSSYQDVTEGIEVTAVAPAGSSTTERWWTGGALAAVLVLAGLGAYVLRRR